MITRFLVIITLTVMSTVASAAEHTIKMLNSGPSGSMVFEPSVLTVAVGDTVKFLPTDAGHNAASIPSLIPSGAENWTGGIGKEVEITIEKEGVYVYQCTPHVMLAMVGVIVAGSPSNLAQLSTDSAAVEKGFVMNKDRLSGYLATIK